MARTTDDRLLIAAISGVADRHARTGTIAANDEPAAIAELVAASNGRADLLAEWAGTMIGFYEAKADGLTARHRLAAQLCILAGADASLIGRWIEIGRKRAADTHVIPYTGQLALRRTEP
jgi:hypothetical protein